VTRRRPQLLCPRRGRVRSARVTLTDNAKLASLAALAKLQTVGGAVTVTGDPALSPEEIAALIARVHP
jgi:hypothetical protein